MMSQPRTEIIRIVFNTADIEDIAGELDIDYESALQVVLDNLSSIEDIAIQQINNRLTDLIEGLRS